MIGFSFGSSALCARPLATDAVVAYQIVLGGRDVTDMVRQGSTEISDITEGRSVCKFVLRDDTKTMHPQPGESVYIVFHGARLFGGTVESCDEEDLDKDPTLLISIRAVDFTAIADKYYVTNRYEDMTIEDIIDDIVNLQTSMNLDGVVLTDVNPGPSMSRVSFNYKKASDCFRDLANATGMQWNISPWRVFMLFDRSTYEAPFSIGDLNPVHRDLKYTRTRSGYRNRQFLRAGREKTAELVDNLRGSYTAPDGGGGSITSPEKRTRTFTLNYDLADIVTIKRDGVTQRWGVRGVDTDSDLSITGYAQWFVEYGSKEISQNSAEDEVNNPTLQPDEVLEVTYKGYYPIIADAEAFSEIKARQAIEGGSGEYQNVEEDQDVDGADFAQQMVQSLLNRYGRIPNQIQYQTDTTGLRAGHLQTNTFAVHGILGAQFLIREVIIKPLHIRGQTLPVMRSSVKALDGERQDGWAEFFRAQWLSGRKFVIRENEKINVSKSAYESIVIGDALTESVHDGVTLQDWDEDPFTWALVGEFILAGGLGYALPGCVCGRSRIGVPYGL